MPSCVAHTGNLNMKNGSKIGGITYKAMLVHWLQQRGQLPAGAGGAGASAAQPSAVPLNRTLVESCPTGQPCNPYCGD